MMRVERRYRAAVIGHKGRGDYGHGLDVAFVGLPSVEIAAVADPDEAGRDATQERTGASRVYADYREMLTRERPDLVAIAPRWLGERVAMVEAAAAVGAHLFVEKPLAATLADADTMLAACQRAGVRMAVAHQGRLHPATLRALQLVREGNIGRLRLVRGYGKLDHRGGGQDTMILGTHVFDLMRLFAGDAAWVSGELLVDSRLAGSGDVREGDEEIAPIAGNGLRATCGFPDGVIGLFESFVGLGTGEDLFGLELVGESGQLSLRGGFTKRLLRYPRPYVLPGAPDDRWEVVPVPDASAGEVLDDRPTPANLVQRANQRLVLDLLAAIEENREPAGSGERARASLELIQAIALAHVSGGRVELPLRQRRHPFDGAERTVQGG
jgi:predicted dehydrogenase